MTADGDQIHHNEVFFLRRTILKLRVKITRSFPAICQLEKERFTLQITDAHFWYYCLKWIAKADHFNVTAFTKLIATQRLFLLRFKLVSPLQQSLSLNYSFLNARTSYSAVCSRNNRNVVMGMKSANVLMATPQQWRAQRVESKINNNYALKCLIHSKNRFDHSNFAVDNFN